METPSTKATALRVVSCSCTGVMEKKVEKAELGLEGFRSVNVLKRHF